MVYEYRMPYLPSRIQAIVGFRHSARLVDSVTAGPRNAGHNRLSQGDDADGTSHGGTTQRQDERRNYTRNEHAPGFARMYARVRLGEWHLRHLIPAVQQVVSELVTTCVLHSSGENVMIWLTRTDTSVIVHAWDASPRPPVQRTPDETDEDGRGLSIVTAFSTRTGFHPYAGGKVTYAEIAR